MSSQNFGRKNQSPASMVSEVVANVKSHDPIFILLTGLGNFVSSENTILNPSAVQVSEKPSSDSTELTKRKLRTFITLIV